MNKKKLLMILRLTRDDLKDFLMSNRKCISGQSCWLWFKGFKLPVLVAHIDTIYNDMFKEWMKRDILYSNNYIWSPNGLGADDRVGVYLLIEMFNQYNVNCLFTDYEEKGGLGAYEACQLFEDVFKDTPYFIELDRRGYKEMVFYNDDYLNKAFYEKLKKYYKKEIGSFSDISIIGQEFNICSVNLSVGFYNEHHKQSEYLFIPSLLYTYEVLPKLLNDLGLKQYKLKKRKYDLYDYEFYCCKNYYDCITCDLFFECNQVKRTWLF